MTTLQNLLARINRIAQPKQDMLTSHVVEERPSPNAMINLRIEDAINGKVISFQRFKYNPHGPNEHELVMYVVGSGDSLLDGIATCITLMEARHGK